MKARLECGAAASAMVMVMGIMRAVTALEKLIAVRSAVLVVMSRVHASLRATDQRLRAAASSKDWPQYKASTSEAATVMGRIATNRIATQHECNSIRRQHTLMHSIPARCDDFAAVFSILRTSPVDDANSIVSLHVIGRPMPRNDPAPG